MPNPNHERTHRLITKGLPLNLFSIEEDLQRVDEMNPCDCPRATAGIGSRSRSNGTFLYLKATTPIARGTTSTAD